MLQLKTIFGRQLREARRAKGITQAVLAERIDRSLEMVGRLERGEIAPSFETIERLVSELGVHPGFLFGGDVKEAPRGSKQLAAGIEALYQLNEHDLARAVRLIKAL